MSENNEVNEETNEETSEESRNETNDETKAVRTELASKLETSFLKDKRYKDIGKSQKELAEDFRAFVVDELLKDRPDLVESGDLESIQGTAERAYSAACRGRLVGASSKVKLLALGASTPFDYIGNWIAKRHDLYVNACRMRDAGNPGPLNVLMGLAPNAEGETIALVDANGVALEHRADKGDAKGKAFRVTHSYLCNVPCVVTELAGKKRTLLITLGIGGERNDDIVNGKCKKCGFVSYKKICPNMIDVKDANNKIVKVPCNTEKPFFEYEDIVSSGFMEVETYLRIVTGEEGEDSVSWTDQTSVLGAKKLICKADMKKLLAGPIKNKIVAGSGLVKFWQDNQTKKGAWVAYIGTVSSVGRSPDKSGRRKVDLDDQSMAFMAGGKAVNGVPIYIPQYVWDLMDGNQIVAYCTLLVIGDVQRREKSQLVNGKWQNLVGQWRDPEIRAWGFYVLDGGIERKIKQDVTEGSFNVSVNKALSPAIPATFDTSGATDDIGPTTVVERVVESSDDKPMPVKPAAQPAANGTKTEDDWV